MIKITCKVCNTPSDHKAQDVVERDEGIVKHYSCSCGKITESVFYPKVAGVIYEDGQVIDQYLA